MAVDNMDVGIDAHLPSPPLRRGKFWLSKDIGQLYISDGDDWIPVNDISPPSGGNLGFQDFVYGIGSLIADQVVADGNQTNWLGDLYEVALPVNTYDMAYSLTVNAPSVRVFRDGYTGPLYSEWEVLVPDPFVTGLTQFLGAAQQEVAPTAGPDAMELPPLSYTVSGTLAANTPGSFSIGLYGAILDDGTEGSYNVEIASPASYSLLGVPV